MEESDPALVARALRGDEAAFQLLTERHSQSVFHLAYRMTGNEQDAEDIVQETFWRIWDHVHQIDKDVTTLGPWIKAIARRRALDRVRLSNVRLAVYANSMETYVVDPAETTGESLVLTHERADAVREACNRLNENQRQVVELAYYRGLSIVRGGSCRNALSRGFS